MITALPRIAIAVEDVEQAMSFFRDPLGLAVSDLSVSSARTGKDSKKAIRVFLLSLIMQVWPPLRIREAASL